MLIPVVPKRSESFQTVIMKITACRAKVFAYCLGGKLPAKAIWQNGPMLLFAVLPVIAAHAKQEREAWPSYERICALAQISKTTVMEAINFMVADGWISKTSKQRRHTHNVYQHGWEGLDLGRAARYYARSDFSA